MKLSIIVIILSSNKRQINSLNGIVNDSSEIIIVDNKSKRTIKDVNFKIIENKENLGFSIAANQGFSIAKGNYLLFLNPDTKVAKQEIEKALSFASKNKIDLLSCKVKNSDGSLQPSCGNFPTIINVILDRIPIVNKFIHTYLIRQENYYKNLQHPNWITGAFLLIKREIFNKLGGFDESFFMYGEDVDLCYRAKKIGATIVYYPDAEVIHYNEGKLPARKRNKAINMRKGITIFFAKYKSKYHLFIWKIILYIESLLRPSLRTSK